MSLLKKAMHVLLLISGALVLLALIGYGLFRWNTTPVLVTSGAPLPVDFPEDGFSHATLEDLLTRYVDATGQVDYEAWSENSADLAQLDSYVTAVAAYSPENAPERFPGATDGLLYWVTAYNALVIKSVLDHWPLESVQDLKAPVEIVKGMGFFYKRRFVLGSEHYNLYQIENSKIFGGEVDPRIHFVLNCGSGSCPVLRPHLPGGNQLTPFLDQVARDFLDLPENLTIDHSKRTIIISEIFEMYEDYFLTAARAQTQNPNAQLVDYLSLAASPEKVQGLKRAHGYEIKFAEYDWSINKTEGSQ
jgi:hypothetical protein